MGSAAVIKIGPHGGHIVGFKDGKPVYAHEAPDLGMAFNPMMGSPGAAAQLLGLTVKVHPTEHDKVQISWRDATHAKAAAAMAAHWPPGTRTAKTPIGGYAIVPRAWAEKLAPPPAKAKAEPKPKPAAQPPVAVPPTTVPIYGAGAFDPKKKYAVITRDSGGHATVYLFGKASEQKDHHQAMQVVAFSGSKAVKSVGSAKLATDLAPTAQEMAAFIVHGMSQTPNGAPFSVTFEAPAAPLHAGAGGMSIGGGVPAAPELPAGIAKAGIKPVDKATLKNPITSWTDSPGHPVIADGELATLVGWEVTGAPPQRTGKLVVQSKAGALKALPQGKVKSAQVATNAPWHHPDVKVWKADAAAKVMSGILDQKVAGMGVTFKDVFSAVHAEGAPCFVVGGFVRDAIIGEQAKDDDMGIGVSLEKVEQIAKTKGWWFTPPGPGGLVKFGDPKAELFLEGKVILGANAAPEKVDPGAPTSAGADLHVENINRDFTMNALWYDPHNNTIVDPTGRGVEDTLTKTLRIPVPKGQWDTWAKGNPGVCGRYWKFIARGYKPADEETRQFLIAAAKKYYGSGVATVGNFKNKMMIQKGIMNDKKDAGAKAKVAKFRAAVVADMGAAFYDKFYGTHEPA